MRFKYLLKEGKKSNVFKLWVVWFRHRNNLSELSEIPGFPLLVLISVLIVLLKSLVNECLCIWNSTVGNHMNNF